MNEFKIRFAQPYPGTSNYYFSNVRSGLVVGLVSVINMRETSNIG